MSLLNLFSDSSPDPHEPCALTINEAFHLLENERRRLVLELVDELGPMQLDALADAVAAITARDRKSTYVTLYQAHLPKLDEYDVIDREDRGHRICPGDHFEECLAFLDEAQQRFESDDGGPHPTEAAHLEGVDTSGEEVRRR